VSRLQTRYKELLERDNTKTHDNERKALFYIIAGNEELYSKMEYIYDFDTRMIKHDLLNINEDSPSYMTEPSSTTRKLLELAFNLYNPHNKVDVHDVFSRLGKENFKLAMEAIQIRFK